MFFAFVEMMWRQDDAEYWNFSFETSLHHAVDNSGCHEIVPIDTAIHYEGRADDGRILTSLCEGFGMKGIS